MSTETREIDVLDRGGRRTPGKLQLLDEEATGSDVVRLSLQVGDREFTAAGEDWFEALRALTKQLGESGLSLRAYGVSKNVYPSPMSRSMGGGHKAFRLRMGQPAKLEDLVSIFDTGPDIEPATAEEQDRFYAEWLASLSGRASRSQQP